MTYQGITIDTPIRLAFAVLSSFAVVATVVAWSAPVSRTLFGSAPTLDDALAGEAPPTYISIVWQPRGAWRQRVASGLAAALRGRP